MQDNTPGARSWVADFTGPAIIIQWGGGGGGAAGEGFTRGGKGGGSGAMVTDLINVVTGQTYNYYNGVGGTGGLYAGDKTGTDGEASYFGGGTTCRAAGGHGAGPAFSGGLGGQVADSLGRARVPGGEGGTFPGTFNGGVGGNAPDLGEYEGGAGGASPGQVGSNPGVAPGGGGSGGGHATGSNGGAGGSGGTVIFNAPDPSIPGYFMIGVDEDYNFSAVGTYDDFVPAGNGMAWFEAVGSGGGGRGGNGLALQGGHGASAGAWAATLREVFRDVSYRRVVPAGGAGTALNGGAGANGADASWALTPLRIIQKQIASNVATLWTCAPGSSTPQKHGLLVGEQVTVAGVDATFNGTYTVTAVATDRLSFSYAKAAANSGPTAVTPTGTSAALTNPFVLAKGGLGATGIYTGGTPQPGGAAASCIGDQKQSGDRGQAVQSGTTTWGGNAGGGALPLGSQGGWGGGSTLAAGNAGDPGQVPGGGGGGGRGATGGSGGAGARGAAVVRWILELNGVWVGGERKSVTRVKVWTGGTSHTVNNVHVWDASARHNTHRALEHPESLKRRYPEYLPENYVPYFDRETGTFNWLDGVGSKILDCIANNDLDVMVFGDSVAEGWTSFDGLVTGTKDFPKAFPRCGRDQLAATSGTLAKGGDGAIRANTVSGVDPQWSISGWSGSGDKHYVTSSNVGHIATFTPGLDSEGVQITGDRVAVVYAGGGITLRIGGSIVATGPATANTATLARLEYSPGSDAAHVLDIRPTAAVNTLLFTADVYKNSGVRLHNLAQGGAKSGGGTGQSYYGPASGMTAPGNMTACYTQPVMVKSAKGQPDVVLIFLGGNDSNAGTDAATIKAAHGRIIDMIQAASPSTAIVLMSDVWTSDRNLALMDLCREKSVGMIDFYYLSRALTSIFGLNYNGDAFGHLNTDGAAWAGAMMHDAFLYNPAP